MIGPALVERIYDAADIQRWNDHIRPMDLTELDKQAHKMVISFVVTKFEENIREVDWVCLIEAGLFEFLHRIVLTDIKPPLFHRIMSNKELEQKVNNWVFDKIGRELNEIGTGFADRFREYFLAKNEEKYITVRRILRASHYLATKWEFDIIYKASPNIYGLSDTKKVIDNELEDHIDLVGVQRLQMGKKSYSFIDLVGQLRFQQRWAQTPRVPKTSVLGHSLIVAILVYLCSLQIGACKKRLYNNFFAALFHDLPEVITRDIISPIKDLDPQLAEMIKAYERQQVEDRILPLLPTAWHEEIQYFLKAEFTSRINKYGHINIVSSDDINDHYNVDEYSPLDGEIIEACDKYSAFVEATMSIAHGIRTKHLERGCQSIYQLWEGRVVAGINFGDLFAHFRDECQGK